MQAPGNEALGTKIVIQPPARHSRRCDGLDGRNGVHQTPEPPIKSLPHPQQEITSALILLVILTMPTTMVMILLDNQRGSDGDHGRRPRDSINDGGSTSNGVHEEGTAAAATAEEEEEEEEDWTQNQRNRWLEVPHPRMHERPFVLRPLADIDPDLMHPILACSVTDLLERVLVAGGVGRGHGHGHGDDSATRMGEVSAGERVLPMGIVRVPSLEEGGGEEKHTR